MQIRPVEAPPASADEIEPLLDHLVYATPDLDASIAAFRACTGLTPAAGGRHLGLGTRNYLVALGPRRYLEIVGPDTEHPPVPGVAMPFGLADLSVPRLVTWAVHPVDIHVAAKASAVAGADLGEVREMQRARPDGVLLRWQLALPAPAPLDGIAPFLIDWGTGPHPADDALPRTDLLGLRGSHPDPESVRRVLDAIGVHLPVERGEPGLIAMIGTAAGAVELR